MNQNLKMLIRDQYDTFTHVEKVIADYFLNEEIEDFSSKHVSQLLYVSEASLSRFAKKLDFKGYREFVFAYQTYLKESYQWDQLTEFTIHKYQEVLEKSYQVIDHRQMMRIASLLEKKKRVFVYGVGSSYLVAKEFCLRFIRLGLDVEAIDGGNEMDVNVSRINEDTMVIGISISGHTKEILTGLNVAHQKGATTILLTAITYATHEEICDEVVMLAHLKNITVSHIISPQIPALILIDILYTHYLNLNKSDKLESLKQVLNQIDYKFEK